MSPDEVLDALRTLGVNTSRSTLLRFEKAGAFIPPKRGAGGRGQGRFTEYDEDTPNLFFATWMLMKAEKIPLEDAVAAGALSQQNTKDREKQLVGLIEVSKESVEEIMRDEDFPNMPRAEWKSLFKFLDGNQDYDIFSLHSAKKYMEVYLDSVVGSGWEAKLCNLISEENKMQVLANKWGDYYSLTKQSMIEMAMEQKYLEQLVEEQKTSISMLKEENQRLLQVLLTHGVTPD